MAEMLGIPHATIVMEVEKLDGKIRVKRELEDVKRLLSSRESSQQTKL